MSDSFPAPGRTADADAKPARYMFDEVFALDTGGRKAPPAITPAALEEAVAAARKEGHAAGLAEGRRTAKTEIDGRLAESVGKLVAEMAQFSQGIEGQRNAAEVEAVGLAMTALRRLVPALIAREPAAEITALLHDCLSSIRDVPHVAIRVSEDLAEPMREKFELVAAQTGFTGRAVVLGEPTIKAGDGRIEWADGGVVRSMDETRRAIEAAVDDFIAVRSGTRPAPKPESPAPGDESNE